MKKNYTVFSFQGKRKKKHEVYENKVVKGHKSFTNAKDWMFVSHQNAYVDA